MSKKIYVASSWRNRYQPAVVNKLRLEGLEVYDFMSTYGFKWSSIDEKWKQWDTIDFIGILNHPLAKSAYFSCFDVKVDADVCILVLPCGRSAHLEAGLMIGWEKPTYIYIPPKEKIEPELMYIMADYVSNSLDFIIEKIRKLDYKHL